MQAAMGEQQSSLKRACLALAPLQGGASCACMVTRCAPGCHRQQGHACMQTGAQVLQRHIHDHQPACSKSEVYSWEVQVRCNNCRFR